MAKKKEDKIPEDIDAELKSPKFTKSKTFTASGYILEVKESDKKVDIQVYEPIAGTTILEGLNLSKKINSVQLYSERKKNFHNRWYWFLR